jgi:hypothetical protein
MAELGFEIDDRACEGLNQRIRSREVAQSLREYYAKSRIARRKCRA